jgi:hypothetical protein
MVVHVEGLLGLHCFSQKVFLLDASRHPLGLFSLALRHLNEAVIEGQILLQTFASDRSRARTVARLDTDQPLERTCNLSLLIALGSGRQGAGFSHTLCPRLDQLADIKKGSIRCIAIR